MRMASVTQRIKQIKQPYGGYLRPSEFEKEEFSDNEILKEENIHTSLVGLAVDYLTRLMLGTPAEEVFKISVLGAKIINEERKAHHLLEFIKGTDDSSIYHTCKLVGYDVCFRSGPVGYKNIDTIEADHDTINNIRIMVNRSILFFNKYGPIIKDGFTFEGGYTKLIDSGDGDFLTSNTLYDFKVSKNNPTSAHTLQLLIYYIMGMNSVHEEFKLITKLGIFNPRLNCLWTKDIASIPQETINEVSATIIGYKEDSIYKESQNKETVPENNDMLSMAEIMKVLSCSRYMVMKYYSEEDLPLVKIKNKYYITKYDLIDWAKRMEEARKKQQITSLIRYVISIAFIIGIILIISKML